MGRFDELSDLDFEELVADLMRAEFGLPFRAGTRGRDAGVDVLAEVDGEKHVVQCKHYRDATLAHLVNAARSEAARLKEAESEFASYRFVTSRRLNHARRKEIADILMPWVSSVDDVYADGDLRGLLRRHQRVEGQHVKLWLAGAGPLEQLLNAGSFERSRALLEEARASLPRFVQTEAFSDARDILRNEGVCVIAGAPGVGKTTLAQLLMLSGLEEGFQPYEIVPGGLRDAWDLLALDEKQLFYFDDFLGQTALHESRQHDSELLRLMRRVAREPGRLFVLATREYILRQAKQLSEALALGTKDGQQFLLTVERYTRQEKARIFYNHIYFSDQIDLGARKSLLAKRRYLAIIDHSGYNPRLIEWLTGWSGHALSKEEKRDYSTYCLSVLDRPEPLWTHAFEKGLGDAGRALVIALLGLPRRVGKDDAEAAFTNACTARGIDLTEHRFIRSLAILEDSFVSIDGGPGAISLGFINPSVIDFLRGYLSSSLPDAELAIKGASFFEQIEWLWNALGRGDNPPPVGLASAFGDAFGRTIDASPPKGWMWWISSAGWNRSEQTHVQGRLGQAVGFLDALPAMWSAMDGWLGSAARKWLANVDEGEMTIDSATPKLIAALSGVGALDLDAGIKVMKSVLEAMPESVDRWELTSDLHHHIPQAFTDGEWERICGAFSEYLAYAVEDPGGYFYNTEEVGTVEDLIFYFDASVDQSLLDEARQTVENAESEGFEYEPDFDDEDREAADFGEGDDDIASMFERLS